MYQLLKTYSLYELTRLWTTNPGTVVLIACFLCFKYNWNISSFTVCHVLTTFPIALKGIDRISVLYRFLFWRVSHTKSESLYCASRAARLRELRGSLRAEFRSVKKSIIVHHQDVKLSNRALDLLMVSAKRNPALTAVAIQNDTSIVSTK